MVTRAIKFAVVAATTLLISNVDAFVSPVKHASSHWPRPMSDVPQPETTAATTDTTTTQFRLDLPPPPENKIVLAGDVLALLVYGFLDHFLCRDVSQVLLEKSSLENFNLATPVWLDQHQDSVWTALYWQDLVNKEFVSHYSPVLQPVGLATILLASTWLVAGWWHQSFSFNNTLDVNKTLVKTGETWMTTSACLLLLVCLTQGGVFQWTKGDMDFILDSLTVITSWRFLVAFITTNMIK